MLITEDADDPRFNAPFVDVDEQRTNPVPHRYIHGGFTGTDARFSFYFPAADRYEGRFFQPTHQLFFSEDAQDPAVTFTIESGAYLVQSNMGGSEYPRSAELALSGKYDPTAGGYRVNAAAAKFSRVKAVELYGEHRPFGYLHGPSGGAFQTITSAEKTEGVWDGFVPQVMGSPNAIPGVFTVRIHTLRVLKTGGKFAAGDGRDRSRWERRTVRGAERRRTRSARGGDPTRVPDARVVELGDHDRRPVVAGGRLRPAPRAHLRRRLLEQAGIPRHRSDVVGGGGADPASDDHRGEADRPEPHRAGDDAGR